MIEMFRQVEELALHAECHCRALSCGVIGLSFLYASSSENIPLSSGRAADVQEITGRRAVPAAESAKPTNVKRRTLSTVHSKKDVKGSVTSRLLVAFYL